MEKSTLFNRRRHAIKCLRPLMILCCGLALERCGNPNGPNASSKELEKVQRSLARIEEELDDLRQALPATVDEKLKTFEANLNHRKQWPRTPDQAEKLRQNIEVVVQSIRPLTAERIMPRLIQLNWATEALWNLCQLSDARQDQFEEAESRLSEIAQNHPRGTFNEIYIELNARLKRLQEQTRQSQLKQSLEKAREALASDKVDTAAAYSALQQFRDEKDVGSLLPKLHARVLERSALERLASLQKSLERARSMPDERVRQAALTAVQGSLLQLLVELQLDDSEPIEPTKSAQHLLTDCDQALAVLSSKQQAHYSGNLRRYQAWALEQIRRFDSPQGWYYDATLPWVASELKAFANATDDAEWIAFKEFPSVKDLVQDKSGVDLSEQKGAVLTSAKRKEIYNAISRSIGWKNNIDTEIAYRVTRDAMVKFLLPIQTRLLDPPVAQLYQQAFTKGWQKLEGREDQLFVAEQSAVVPKRTLEEVASSQH